MAKLHQKNKEEKKDDFFSNGEQNREEIHLSDNDDYKDDKQQVNTVNTLDKYYKSTKFNSENGHQDENTKNKLTALSKAKNNVLNLSRQEKQGNLEYQYYQYEVESLEEKIKKNLDFKNQTIVKWEAFSFPVYEPTKLSKIMVFLIFAVLQIYAAINRSFSTFFIVLTIGLLIFLYSKVEPEIIINEITFSGIRSKDKFYEFENIKGFWIEYNNFSKELTLVLKNEKLNKVLQLGDSNPNVLRAVLSEFIPELPVERDFFNIISKIFRI